MNKFDTVIARIKEMLSDDEDYAGLLPTPAPEIPAHIVEQARKNEEMILADYRRAVELDSIEFGTGICAMPEYMAEQARANADLRKAMDDIDQFIVAAPGGYMSLAEACKRNNDLFAKEEKPAAKPSFPTTLHSDPLGFIAEKPIDIMAVTRGMCK